MESVGGVGPLQVSGVAGNHSVEVSILQWRGVPWGFAVPAESSQ